jgi:hypothetical protein
VAWMERTQNPERPTRLFPDSSLHPGNRFSIFKQPNSVIASSAKQSMAQHKERMDCFVATAPRNDVDTVSRSRRRFLREVFFYFPPSPMRGRGEAGRPVRPITVCAMDKWVERTHVSQVTPESPGAPHAVVYAYNVLSPVNGSFATVARAP